MAPAVGIGVTMCLPMDQIVTSPAAKFGMGFIKMGLVPELASTRLLADRVGFGRASDLCLSGRLISGEEAYRIGLADRLAERRRPARHGHRDRRVLRRQPGPAAADDQAPPVAPTTTSWPRSSGPSTSSSRSAGRRRSTPRPCRRSSPSGRPCSPADAGPRPAPNDRRSALRGSDAKSRTRSAECGRDRTRLRAGRQGAGQTSKFARDPRSADREPSCSAAGGGGQQVVSSGGTTRSIR